MFTIISSVIVFGSLIALATLICGTILIIVKTRGNRNSSGASDSEEAKIIQEIYQSLEKLEERIESLETILMDDQEKDRNKK